MGKRLPFSLELIRTVPFFCFTNQLCCHKRLFHSLPLPTGRQAPMLCGGSASVDCQKFIPSARKKFKKPISKLSYDGAVHNPLNIS